MPHFSLWTDMAVMFAVVIVVILLVMFHFNNSRRPRPTRRKVPERIDKRLAEILEHGSNSPEGMPVRSSLPQEAACDRPPEGPASVAVQPAETLQEKKDAMEGEGRPREEASYAYPRVAEAGSARLFQGEEEEPLGGDSNELRARLKDRYAMYLRDQNGS